MFISAILASALTASPDSRSAFERFFIGSTESSGTVHVIASGRHSVHTRSEGRREASGALIIDQTVEEKGKPVRRSTWRLVRAESGGITGTMSDGKGAIVGEITGNTLHLRYQMQDGPAVKQWISLQPDGRTASNRITYHRFGLRVATVEMVIRKIH